MKVLNNINDTVRDDLLTTIKKDSKVSIAAACFSIYAYQELRKQLEDVDQLRFIFTSPTFLKEKTEKASREFYIPRLNRERNLYGTDFEIKLRNELTQRAIAKECADWVRRKVVFKSKGGVGGTLLRYYILWICQTACSYGLITLFTMCFGADNLIFKILIKPVVDIFLFLLSYRIQRDWVFKSGKKKNLK